MKPEVDLILGRSADQLIGLMPELSASYSQGSAAVLALLIKFAAGEYERGADIRAAENADIRALFVELAPIVRDTALKKRVEAGAVTRESSLTISALNAVNSDLRRVLIVLQVHVEDIGARAAEKRIWNLLKAIAARRAVSLF
jgi:hypothetical protein